MMARKASLSNGLKSWSERRMKAIWSNLWTNHLWQRMLKNTIATTLCITLALIPRVVEVYGRAAYLVAIVSVFGHPGRRFGVMAEALILVIVGTVLGVAWSMFGIYLSSLIYEINSPAAYTIKGIFLVLALLFHGFLRSSTPRLWLFVLLFIIVSVVGLTGTSTAVSATLATNLLYPILTSAGILLLVNICIYPEFSSTFLGVTTIETLSETVATLKDAGRYFKHVDIAVLDKSSEDMEKLRNETNGESSKQEDIPDMVQLKSLTDAKPKLRAKLAGCKAAQTECNFELAWAVLPPRDLKPISDLQMKKLVANTIALIGACESRYALMGDESNKKEAESKDEHQLKEVANAADLSPESVSTRHSSIDSSQNEDEAPKMKQNKKTKRSKRNSLSREMENLELVKPNKEISSGDIQLLRFLLDRISKPLEEIQDKIGESVNVVTSCLAYCYDVQKLPSGALAPTGISLEEIDIRVDIMSDALASFDSDSAQALESVAAIHELDRPQIDIMPRMEIFLISSFILNLRQAAQHVLQMLRHSREIVEKRQARHNRRRLYAPRIQWRKWLASGGEEDKFSLPESGKKAARMGEKRDDTLDGDESSTNSKETLVDKTDEETAANISSPSVSRLATQHASHIRKSSRRTHPQKSLMFRFRNGLADIIEFLAGSDDVLYALKLTCAVFLVSWPAFVGKWNAWFSLNRGLWASLQLILITEVAIGTSVVTFTLRALGTTIGCLWGWAAYEIGNGNRVVCVIFLVIGIIPSTYIQLGTTDYIKAGMVSIVSMCIVALAIEDHTTSGSPTAVFLRRFLAFLIGGTVALFVEVALFPVKARDRLVESLSSSVLAISEMEACLAYGIETEANIDVRSEEVQLRFERAKGKASGALAAAETFLPFCGNEPRLKGSFKGLALVYAEILYVLHAIVDRMDNMIQLRHSYGSGIIEEHNEKVFHYRRNVAGSITLILFAVHEALTTKLPLPQFLPSARLAHLRMINRVREVVLSEDIGKYAQRDVSETDLSVMIERSMIKRVVRQKFLSWNAASAGQIEVIEYLEELVDLVKLLVGANEFRSGLLTRPTYREYANHTDHDAGALDPLPSGDSQNLDGIKTEDQDELRDSMPEPDTQAALRKRRTTMSKTQDRTEKLSKKKSEDQEFAEQKQAIEEELPRSLQRVRSRRIEELHLQKSRSQEEKGKGKVLKSH